VQRQRSLQQFALAAAGIVAILIAVLLYARRR